MSLKEWSIKNILLYKKVFIIISLITGVVFAFVMCNEIKKNKQSESVEDNIGSQQSQYIGASACMSCHKEIYESHITTPHFNATAFASVNKIKGRFDEKLNEYRFSARTVVKCEKVEDKLYQVAYIDGVEKMRQEFSIVFGYGKNAQSFAAWSKSKLVQLPLSYFSTAGQWINSPGYPEKVVFNRVITSRCMECHATFARVSSQEGVLENFDRSSIILGVDCEKCHGPASKHVEFKTKYPDVKDQRFIINPAGLTRQQNLDACALCHSGNMNNIQPSFSFRPGDDLKKFYSYSNVAQDVKSLDVHGNQYGLLTLSRCFAQSQMTCSSCHNSHKNETGQLITFSQRCMVCHSPNEKKTFCSVTDIEQSILEQECINCHMPEKESATIVFSNHETGTKVSAKMRSHHISIYPQETKEIMFFLKKNKKPHR